MADRSRAASLIEAHLSTHPLLPSIARDSKTSQSQSARGLPRELFTVTQQFVTPQFASVAIRGSPTINLCHSKDERIQSNKYFAERSHITWADQSHTSLSTEPNVTATEIPQFRKTSQFAEGGSGS